MQITDEEFAVLREHEVFPDNDDLSMWFDDNDIPDDKRDILADELIASFKEEVKDITDQSPNLPFSDIEDTLIKINPDWYSRTNSAASALGIIPFCR